jgi:hypothetical protein
MRLVDCGDNVCRGNADDKNKRKDGVFDNVSIGEFFAMTREMKDGDRERR